MDRLYMKYFVLKPDGAGIYARASRKAMITYAEEIRKTEPSFADEILKWVKPLIVDWDDMEPKEG